MDQLPRPVLLSRAAMLRLLGALDDAHDEAAQTWYRARNTAEDPSPPQEAREAADRHDWGTGTVAFWGEAARLVIAPPFPLTVSRSFPYYHTAELRSLLEASRTLGVILVRLGGYSVGIYENGRFAETKTGGRFVKNRHRKGGQSQRRFERIREGQIREHFDDVAEVVRTRLLPAADRLDAVILGGDRHTIQALLKRAPLPPTLAAKALPRVIDTPEPRRDVLERTPTAIWSSRAIVFREPSSGG